MKHTLATLILTAVSSQGATLTVNLTNSNFAGTNPFFDTDGTTFLEQNDLVILGYFSDGSLDFSQFVPINTVSFDIGIDGGFSAEPTLDDTVDLIGAPPAATYQFGYRIFNAETEEAATHFNTVTDASWNFAFWDGVGVPPPTASMSVGPVFGAQNPVWESGAGSAFQTSIPIPEPSTSLSALLGLALLAGSRRRK